MTTRSDAAELMRTFVQGDREANQRYEQLLDEQEWAGFPLFIGALFYLAVRYRLGEGSRPDIIRFVADLRAQDSDWRDTPSPIAMENHIRRVFDPDLDVKVDESLVGEIETTIAYRILQDADLTPEELDTWLGEAERIAEQLPD